MCWQRQLFHNVSSLCITHWQKEWIAFFYWILTWSFHQHLQSIMWWAWARYIGKNEWYHCLSTCIFLVNLAKRLYQWRLISKKVNGSYNLLLSFLGGSVVKNPPASVGDTGEVGLIPGPGRSLRMGNGNPLQYSCLGNPMDRGAWWATVNGVSKNRTKKEKESDTTEHAHTTKNYMMGNSHLKSIPVMMVGTVCCWRTPSVPGDRELSSSWPGDSVGSFLLLGDAQHQQHNWVLKVCLYLESALCNCYYASREAFSSAANLCIAQFRRAGRGAHRGFGVREKTGGRLVYQGKQSFPRKGSRLDRWTSTVLFLVLNQFPSLHPDSGSRDH